MGEGLIKRVVATAAAGAIAVALVPAAGVAAADQAARDLVPGTEEAALAAAQRPYVPPEERPRLDRPEDRYAMAGGCYVVRSVARDAYFTRADGTAVADEPQRAAAEPFHFQATDLGRYLLYATERDFLAVSEGLVGEAGGRIMDNSVGAMVSGLTRERIDALLDDLAASPLGTASGRGGGIELAEAASPLADWEIDAVPGTRGVYRIALPTLARAHLAVTEDGGLTLVPARQAGPETHFTFHLGDGCADWPEVELNVDGPLALGESPFGEVMGFFDGHLHGMAFEFLGGRARCGQPWHPYGVEYALRGCQEHELLGGRTHILETALSGRDPVRGHDTQGWPTFADWPEHWSLTYEQTYYRWLERAWRGGLRMYTNLLVDNNKLCEVYPFKRNSCNEMDGVRLQAQRIREFERYIDAQHGGPGRGWLRIVTDPFQARRVMNEGRLAVVLGIEVSVLFDCSTTADMPECDTDQIDAQLAEVYDLGVRQMELVNKFDNAFSGVAGDAGPTGILVNSANFWETGSFWQMGPCEDHHDHDHDAHDRTHPNLADDAGLPEELFARDALAGMILDEVGTTGLAPVYGPGPHCNQRGLTDLGAYVLHRMMERGMIFDPDHMSAKARYEAMEIMEREGYSGIISSHSWADDGIYEWIWRLGGVVTPMARHSWRFIEEWEKNRAWQDGRFLFGFGYGSDVNGFAAQGAPRPDAADNPVVYPFEGLGGVTIDRQVSGERTFDINTDGVAHYGLYPDWLEDLRVQAGDAIIQDMARGAEAYLQMWERALGVAPDSCRSDVPALTNAEVAQVKRGMAPEQVLLTLGQPNDRTGTVFTFCLGDNRRAEVHFREGVVHRVTARAATAAEVRAGEQGRARAEQARAARGGRHVHAHDHGPQDTEVQADRRALPTQAMPAGAHRHGSPVGHDCNGDSPRFGWPRGAADGCEAHVSWLATGAGLPTPADRSGPVTAAVLLLGLSGVALHATRRTLSS